MNFNKKCVIRKIKVTSNKEKIENLISENIKNSLLINSKNLLIIKLKG